MSILLPIMYGAIIGILQGLCEHLSGFKWRWWLELTFFFAVFAVLNLFFPLPKD